MKKALKIGGGIIGAVLLLLLGYVIYVFAAYDRIEDNQELSVQAGVRRKIICTYRNAPSISLRGI